MRADVEAGEERDQRVEIEIAGHADTGTDPGGPNDTTYRSTARSSIACPPVVSRTSRSSAASTTLSRAYAVAAIVQAKIAWPRNAPVPLLVSRLWTTLSGFAAGCAR
jgi:hypothetical protein